MTTYVERIAARSGHCLHVEVFGTSHAIVARYVPLEDVMGTARIELPDDDDMDDVRQLLGWSGAVERRGTSPARARWLFVKGVE